ncbi:hypothetical protein B9Z55_028486 [Caenorhabditis nigoni]|uniref:Uncharacterized protein n=1 Tax=Caenorhabditis nigoni TaxID=1611254 RepID=A0A2G5SBD2_9PELO|nr:hypothetical protein B9Z55_028486 [Caenorhabditis nigoni]
MGGDVIGKARPAVRRPTHIPQHQSETETPPVLGRIVFDDAEFASTVFKRSQWNHFFSETRKTVALIGPSGKGNSTCASVSTVLPTVFGKNLAGWHTRWPMFMSS